MPTKKKKSFKDYVTKPKSNAGVKVVLPETDGQWVKLLGADSDKFRETSIELIRSVKENTDELNEEQIAKRAESNRITLIANCVVGWSFSEPCNFKNVSEFLVNAPQILKFIDVQIANQSLFLGKNLKI